MGFLKWLEDAVGNVGRTVGTAADAVIPGDQSSWHQPAPPQPASTARPQQTRQPARKPLFAQQLDQAVHGVGNFVNGATNARIPGLGVTANEIAAQVPKATNDVIHAGAQVGDSLLGNVGHLADVITYPIVTKQYEDMANKGEISQQTASQLMNDAGQKAGFNIDDQGGTVLRKTAGAVAMPTATILTGGAAPEAVAALKTVPLTTKLIKGTATGAGVGAGFGAIQTLGQQDPITLQDAAMNIGGGALGGAALGAAAPIVGAVTTKLARPMVAEAKAGFPNTLANQEGRIGPNDKLPISTPQEAAAIKANQQAIDDAFFKNAYPDNVGATAPRSAAANLPSGTAVPSAPAELPSQGVKHVSTIDKAMRSTRSIIERQGEHGQQLGGVLQTARDKAELHLAELQKAMPTVHSLKGKDFQNFVETTQGQAEATSPKIKQAVQEWQNTHPAIRDAAVKAGLDVGDLGPKYYPHFIDYEAVFKNRDTYNEAINHLVKTGQAPSAEEAIKLLGYARDVSRNRQFGNLEASRLVDIPMYDKTPNSLVSYLNGSTKRIAQTNTFGAKDENALKLIAKAGGQGYDTEAMKNAYDIAVGAKQYNPSTTKFSNAVRAYNSTTRLGLGAITNSSQNVNTGIVTGHLRTLGAMVKQLDKKTQSYVADTGVISDAVLNDIKSQTGFIGKSLSKITAPGFNAVEKFNRSVAATAGRDYALRLAQKGDEATLRKLGVTGEIKGSTLTHDQQIQASRKVVEKTQFKVDAQDLPGWADSPGGKLVAQFRTFSYNQSKFFSNEIVKPAAKGNLLPLGRLLAALPVGYGLYETKRVIAGRPEEENKGRLGLESFGNIGGAGLAVDLFRGLVPLNGKYLSPDRFTSMMAGTLGGPAVGNLVDFAGGASQAVQKKNLPKDGDLSGKLAIATPDGYYDETQLARFGLRQIPIVGTAIQNRVLPYGSSTTTQTAGLTPKQQAMETSIANSEKQAAAADANGTRGKAPKKSSTGSKTLDASNKRVDTATGKLPDGMSADSAAILKRYALLNADGKAKFSADPANKLKLHQAQYEQNKLSGKLTGPKDLSTQQSLAKESITSQYSQEVKDFYGLSNAQKNEYFKRDPNKAKELYAKAKELDSKLGGTGSKVSLATKAKGKSTGKKTAKGSKKFDYTKTVAATNTSAAKNQSALRKLVQAPKISRKRIA